MSKPRFFEGRRLDRPNEDVEDQGLAFDMGTVLSRRRLLGVLGVGAGATALAACGASGTQKTGAGANGTASTESTTSANSNSLTEMNTETAGPYPGDGSNGPDVLDETGIERRDLKNSVDGNGSVEGVPMTLTMRLVDISNDNQPLVGAAVYVWHCNAEGEYSMYSNGVTDQTWLRGVQVTDDDGAVTFDSIVPGCYDGRWPHIHFEVFPDLDAITDATNAVLTSQLVIPEEVETKCMPTHDMPVLRRTLPGCRWTPTWCFPMAGTSRPRLSSVPLKVATPSPSRCRWIRQPSRARPKMGRRNRRTVKAGRAVQHNRPRRAADPALLQICPRQINGTSHAGILVGSLDG